MDLADWVEEAESLLRLDGLWPEQDEERARGVLEEAALQGPAAVTQAIYVLRRELRERSPGIRGRSDAKGAARPYVGNTAGTKKAPAEAGAS
ncbi:MAG: hypothetical protein WBN30_08940 [Polyangiales bacterium]